MKEDSVELLREFIQGSSSFDGFTFKGCYGMNPEKFLIMFGHFIKTGENHLDEYSEMTWAGWGDQNQGFGFEYIGEEEREQFKKWFAKNSFWDFSTFVSAERYREIERNISKSEAFDEKRRSYKFRRSEACRHTNKKNVRKKVFEIHGEFCSKCGAVENIQIDHIVPVAKMGQNAIENYIPLCRSCNASKGSK